MKSRKCALAPLVVFILVAAIRPAEGLQFDVIYQGGFWDGDLGKQRRDAFAAALEIWGDQLVGTVPVKVRAEFRSFNEPPGSLHVAESDSASANAELAGLPEAHVWFPAALASQLTGVSLPATGGNPMNIGFHMYCEFNSDTDGFVAPDNNTWAFHYQPGPLPPHRIDFVRTALHEIGHCLGFQVVPQYWTQSPPDFPYGMPCIYSCGLLSRNTDCSGYFVELSRPERDFVMIMEDMWWWGPNIVALDLPALPNNDGINPDHQVEIYAPPDLQPGVSLDHWDTSLPISQYNLLMRQPTSIIDIISTQSTNIDLTRHVLTDIWWSFTNTSVTPAHLDFQGSSAKAAGLPQSVILANNGPTLTVTALTFVGPHLADFSFTAPTLPCSVPKLGSMAVPISFDPSDTGYRRASLHIEWSCNGTHSFDVPLTGIATAVDSDEDGISDYDETRDLNLDPNAPGIHNPFDAALADSTGGNGHIGRDWVPDGLNDWDGDGMLNGEEFMFGYNPIDRTSYGHCTASDTDGDGISDADEASTQWLEHIKKSYLRRSDQKSLLHHLG